MLSNQSSLDQSMKDDLIQHASTVENFQDDTHDSESSGYEEESEPAFSPDDLSTPSSSPSKAKLPLGATVSPMSPFYNQQAKKHTLEKARAQVRDRSISSTSASTSTTYNPRSRSSSITTSASIEEKNLSVAPVSRTSFPASMPQIRFEDWKRFGIEIFTPDHDKPEPEMYYEYRQASNRPRSKSSAHSSHEPTIPSRNQRSNSHPSSSMYAVDPVYSGSRYQPPRPTMRRATLTDYYCPDLD